MKFGDLVDSGVKELGVRFTFVSILPTALLFLYILILVWSGAPGKTPSFASAAAHVKALESSNAIFLGLVVLALAAVTQPLQLNMVRLLEGYWGYTRLARFFSDLAVGLQRKRRTLLKSAQCVQSTQNISAKKRGEMIAAAVKLRDFYPSDQNLLPTALGNVLRAAEENAGKRYGLDAVVVWPRLYPLISGSLSVVLRDQRNQLDIAARFCCMCLLGTVVTIGMLFHHGLWNLLALALLVLAWGSYRAAIAAALAYGVNVQTAFDLHRFELYKALKLPMPKDRNTERAANRKLSLFLRQGKPVNLQYSFEAMEQENGEHIEKELHH